MTDYTNKGAIIEGQYRYLLWRSWNRMYESPSTLKTVNFVMLNPSTADGDKDDPTIRSCVRLAYEWGYSGILIFNLFAYRATNPKELSSVEDPVGPYNDVFLTRSFSGPVVCAWGRGGNLFGRGDKVRGLLTARHPLLALALNKDGTPKHPLYCRSDTVPLPWDLVDKVQ